MRAAHRQHGFTLIELVITLVLSTIVVSFVAMFISGPVQGFTDQSRRVRLVDAADASLKRIVRDIRRSLPNSVRIASSGSVTVLELLSTVDGGRYRAQPPGAPNQILDFAGPDQFFNVLGPFTQIAKPFSSADHYLAIYNVGVPGANAYALANVITPPGMRISIAADTTPGEDRVTLQWPFRFAYESPTQRVFLVEGPVTYLCNSALGTLTRYAGYEIRTDQSDVDTHGELLGVGATPSLMANEVSGCSFAYTPGTAQRAGLVSLQIVVSAQGERVSLLSQVHVDNVP
jgi:MSHA biogenesis protein MshO